eukprot:10531899-Prorocentrum_lima.AAC.1
MATSGELGSDVYFEILLKDQIPISSSLIGSSQTPPTTRFMVQWMDSKQVFWELSFGTSGPR